MNNELPNAREVGIFWEVDGALVIAGAFLREAQRMVDSRTLRRAPKRCGSNYQHIGAVPVNMDYYEAPSGRVVCDKVTRQFHLPDANRYFTRDDLACFHVACDDLCHSR